MTKRQIKDEFWKVVDESRENNNRLFKLYEEHKVTYGFYLVHNMYDNYHYEVLSNKSIDELTKITMEICLSEFKNAMNELSKIVEEQENLPFEETQMQVLIKEGKIQWM